jgi:hypothetical protein
MDAAGFDALTRTFTAAGPRRRALAALGGVLGLTLGAFVTGGGAARKKPCSVCKRRKNGRCKPKRNDTACGGGKVCQRGNCVCPSGLTDCGGTCVDTATDRFNCSACRNTCLGGKICQGGACVCPGGTEVCGAGCRTIETCTDTLQCGGRACCQGQCRNSRTQPCACDADCCGEPGLANLRCQGGVCCGAQGFACTSGEVCCSGSCSSTPLGICT